MCRTGAVEDCQEWLVISGACEGKRFVVRLFEETRRHNSMQSFHPKLQEKVWPLKEPLHCCLMNTVHSAIGLCWPEGFCRVTIRRSYQLSAVMGCFASLELELVSRT